MNLFKITLTLAIIALLTGCPDPRFTGGGWIALDDGAKANFGFMANGCDDGVFKGNFNYHDKFAGFKIQGDFEEMYMIGPYACMDFVYTSKTPGETKGMTGDGYACVRDRGEGANDPSDQFKIYLDDGPFGGYFAMGRVHGNIQSHYCAGPEED